MRPSSITDTSVPEYLLRCTAAGTWVLSGRDGREGGTFRSREAAVRFVRHASGGAPVRIAVEPGVGEPAVAA